MATSDTRPLQLLCRKLETHHPLTREDEQAVSRLPFKLRTLEAQSYLVREGDKPEQCAVLLSGYAFRHKLTGDGSRQILSLHIPGEALDLQHLFVEEADHNVQMLTRGEVAEIPRQVIEELALSNSNLGRAILVYTLAEASVFREWTLNIGRRDSRSRIAHLLCEFAVRLSVQGLKPESGYELPMTQEQLADATGLTPVHVNRVLKGLQTEGLITRNRRMIAFPHWQRLREVADFNTRYLHLADGKQPA
jgi:CRP-like cAMP-binding protein